MTNEQIIETLVTKRDNTLSVKSVEVVKNPDSLANPCIRVGTQPFYEWSKEKKITYVITYGRYLNCEMLVYDKQIKADKDYIFAKGIDKAVAVLNKILSNPL